MYCTWKLCSRQKNIQSMCTLETRERRDDRGVYYILRIIYIYIHTYVYINVNYYTRLLVFSETIFHRKNTTYFVYTLIYAYMHILMCVNVCVCINRHVNVSVCVCIYVYWNANRFHVWAKHTLDPNRRGYPILTTTARTWKIRSCGGGTRWGQLLHRSD